MASGRTIYNITDLGTLGGSVSEAYGLNDSGQAAGMATTVFGSMHAISFGASGNQDLTFGSGAAEGAASGINNSGQISGTQYLNGQSFATVWSNGVAQAVAGTGAGSFAMGINTGGDVAGMFTASGSGQAFVTQAGNFHALGAMPGSSWSSAYALNNAGQAAGYGNQDGAMRAFVWSPQSGYVVLGTFGGRNSYAMAINDLGQVAGQAQESSGFMHAFLWSAGGMQDLGTLAGGSSSYAYSVNASGDVVGYASLANGADHAFLFEGGMMIDLNSLIDPASGWTLTQAYGINASGAIVGAGMFNGVEQAFLLNPSIVNAIVSKSGPVTSSLVESPAAVPEPSGWALTLAGMVGLIVLKRVKRGTNKA